MFFLLKKLKLNSLRPKTKTNSQNGRKLIWMRWQPAMPMGRPHHDPHYPKVGV
jgi:hypothetical protein